MVLYVGGCSVGPIAGNAICMIVTWWLSKGESDICSLPFPRIHNLIHDFIVID